MITLAEEKLPKTFSDSFAMRPGQTPKDLLSMQVPGNSKGKLFREDWELGGDGKAVTSRRWGSTLSQLIQFRFRS